MKKVEKKVKIIFVKKYFLASKSLSDPEIEKKFNKIYD